MHEADILNDFPFTFIEETTVQVYEMKTRCEILTKLGVHGVGMWIPECCCGDSSQRLLQRTNCCWGLCDHLCPCGDPKTPVLKRLINWNDYYEWRGIPLHSPAAILLHWPLTVYHSIQVAIYESMIPPITSKLCIHYLGPDKELHQIGVFGELKALFPGVKINVEMIGPAIPQYRDKEMIYVSRYTNHCGAQSTYTYCDQRSLDISDDKTLPITLRFHKGLYHNLYTCISKEYCPPDIVIAPNAGVAAYLSWLPTLALLKRENVCAVFSDYCEEAAQLGSSCVQSITNSLPTIPVQLNPFRQPLATVSPAPLLRCYSNYYLFGM